METPSRQQPRSPEGAEGEAEEERAALSQSQCGRRAIRPWEVAAEGVPGSCEPPEMQEDLWEEGLLGEEVVAEAVPHRTSEAAVGEASAGGRWREAVAEEGVLFLRRSLWWHLQQESVVRTTPEEEVEGGPSWRHSPWLPRRGRGC